MKFKLHAGAEMDLLTRDELGDELRSLYEAWKAEIPRGVKFRPFSASASVSAARWTVGDAAANNDKDPLGPQSGFVWAVTRLNVAGNGVIQGTDLWEVYLDSASPSKQVSNGHTRYVTYDVGVFVVHSPSTLVVTGAGTGVAGTDVWVSGQAVELPKELAWQLL